MVLRKLSSGELVQIQLSHDEEGRRYALVYGVGFRLRKGTRDYAEAKAEAQLLADEVEILADEE